MNKSLFLLATLLTVVTTPVSYASSTGQATDLGEKLPTVKKTVRILPPFDQKLVPAELPFIKRCQYEKIEVNWEYTRRSFLRVVRYSRHHFEREVRENLHIDYDKLEELGLQDLYDQYKDFYNNWYGLSSEQKENKKPVVSMASSCSSSSSSSSSSTSTISSTAVEDDADTISSVTPLLRQRHPTTSSSTLEVK